MEDAPEHAFMSFVVTTFMNSLEQFAKLGFGKVENMLSKYQEMTVGAFKLNMLVTEYFIYIVLFLQLYQSVYTHSPNTPPLYLTVVGSGACDLGRTIFL